MIDFINITTDSDPGTLLQLLILIPAATGMALFLVPEKMSVVKGIVAVLTIIVTGFISFRLYELPSLMTSLSEGAIKLFSSFKSIGPAGDYARYITFNSDSLSKLIVLLISIFTFLIIIYSIVYIRKFKTGNYYSWILITAGCSYGAAVSDNMLLFLTFWGILGITLFKLIPGNSEDSSATAKKTLILIGASDTIMLIGIAIIWRLTGSLSLNAASLHTDNLLTATAFIALLAGSFTKAGAFPFHTWVPDYSKNAPASSTAFLPASLDKLLGIYFLARITTGMFIPGEWMTLLLLLTGGITIISAVMMALIQHDYKRLLGFHAVSQVGYMIVGFGLGSFLGVAAGLFHMINNVVYKSGLFLAAGNIEYRTGQGNIEGLGGLSKTMPVTFAASLIFALSISGIPPFNGFASKWMIYQGIIEFGSGSGIANRLWILWLGLAVLGSALTLASFIKLIGGIFLGRRNKKLTKVTEVPFLMWLPCLILAITCIVTGVLATRIIVPRLLMGVTGEFPLEGYWNPGLVSLLLLISIAVGLLVYLLTGVKKFRSEDSFVGGEKIQDKAAYPTPEFYKTISEIGLFSWLYKKAEEKWFDIYELGKWLVLWISHQLSKAHSGVLPGYIIWVFAGLVILLLIMN